MAAPKALLFDIGGVCVVSPFQAILDYEIVHGIPTGYINFAISRGAPSGAFHRLERGEITLNDDYFAEFKSDLSRADRWAEYWDKLETARIAKEGGSKREAPKMPPIDAKAMFWGMMRQSRTPDPWMYFALHKLQASGKFIIAALSNTVILLAGIIDDKNVVFESGLKFDNGIVRPAGAKANIQSMFDAFVSSAHVGLRKPDPAIYKLALEEINKVSGSRGRIEMKDVVFVDDIGMNLKAARELGMRTVKVTLGKTADAVKELESVTGLSLLEDKSRL